MSVCFRNMTSLFLLQICSLMRGGIAERGGIRVGHRIIEIDGQSVVATPHDKIIQILTNAVGEVRRDEKIPYMHKNECRLLPYHKHCTCC